ncbi:hypothetical protein ADICEAN_03982 [Cesiribacter andamanensis AMV16]|uniref:Uncharacterized protein n=2 Tax=Cesiribacter TaxID=1133570 RepID=M7N0Q7_9BACT|nr:hypothetical protein ADICEAN_03982 [Cesiribacter andamanensis AMV16]
MRLLPDQELIGLITERADDYRPEALQAAREVLRERKIDPQHLQEDYARSQAQPEELVQQRLAEGESLEAIVAQLHEQKLDSFDLLHEKEAEMVRTDPEEGARRKLQWKRIMGWFLLVLGSLRFYLGLPQVGLNAWTMKTLGFLLIGLWLLAKASGGLTPSNRERSA